MRESAENRLEVVFPAKSENEALARALVTAFAVQLDPTLEELSDLKTAVSEAVTNAIIHGYRESSERDGNLESLGKVRMDCLLFPQGMEVRITDYGCGIPNIEQAKQPMYTSAPELERSGMGFTIMESFMDKVEVHSELGQGTTVTLCKTFASLSKR